MKLREIHVRTGLFAVSFAALLWGYHILFLHHAPDIFNEPLEDMSYGWYVPLFSLYVLWRERRELVESVDAPSLNGFMFALPFFFAGFLGVRGLQIRLEILGFVGTLGGLVWAFFGFKTLRRASFPLLFLLFCLPLHSYLDLVTIHLRLLAVSVAEGILSGCGANIARQGTMLTSPTGAFAIDVAEPCSGMRSLFAMMALTAGYAYYAQQTWLRRGLLFALSIPIAVFGNVLRILTIVAIAATCSSDFATGFYHDYSGYVVFLAAILLMVSAGGLISKGFSR